MSYNWLIQDPPACRRLKFNFSAIMGKSNVWCKPNTSHHPKKNTRTVKGGGDSIML